MKSFDDLKKYAISDILSASGKDKITRVAENHINNLIEVALIKGAQSRQSEVDELKKRIDAAIKEIQDESWSDEYGDNQAPTFKLIKILKGAVDET